MMSRAVPVLSQEKERNHEVHHESIHDNVCSDITDCWFFWYGAWSIFMRKRWLGHKSAYWVLECASAMMGWVSTRIILLCYMAASRRAMRSFSNQIRLNEDPQRGMEKMERSK